MTVKETSKAGGGMPPQRDSTPTVVGPVRESKIDLQHEDDEVLVRRTQQGDRFAFDVLVGRYKERLYATVYHMTSNHEDANDLVQDTFIKAYKSLRSFRGQSSFYTWIYRIAVNRTINFIKRRKNRNQYSLDDLDSSIQTDPDLVELMSHVTPRREVGLTELQQKLNEALQQLSEAHRAVVTMHDIQGMTHVDIARVMKCSEGTVRSRLFYARQQLQGLLSDYL
ncbi:MAG TPA: sigma-70 family RNA polymerase sigma factor [Verrucomicrobiae bacterium]|nr:sigma-70 family RNA polymerase sigma factor [Verrucomicrobiae bacterium]